MNKIKINCDLIPFTFPSLSNVKCFFTTKNYGNLSMSTADAGVDEVNRREDLSRLLGFNEWTELDQVHGASLLINPEKTDITSKRGCLKADGSSTSRIGHALFIKAADCQPILLAHKSGKYIAALHSGWRGNAIQFPITGVKDFCNAYNIKAEDVLAVRGPSLGPSQAEFINFYNEWPKGFDAWYDNTTHCMNLWSLLKSQLVLAGLLPENIYSIDLCTKMMNYLFFSHRCKDMGRQGSLIFIEG